MAEAVEFAGGTRAITEGEWAGWRNWGADPWEDAGGPFFYRVEDDGSVRCAFKAEPRHMNGGGFMHGGCLVTFADYALFAIAWKDLNESYAVTVSLNSEFISSGAVGDLVEATGEVVKAGGSLIFVRGRISVEDRTVMTFSGIIRKLKPR